jgi:hypothetical protein
MKNQVWTCKDKASQQSAVAKTIEGKQKHFSSRLVNPMFSTSPKQVHLANETSSIDSNRVKNLQLPCHSPEKTCSSHWQHRTMGPQTNGSIPNQNSHGHDWSHKHKEGHIIASQTSRLSFCAFFSSLVQVPCLFQIEICIRRPGIDCHVPLPDPCGCSNLFDTSGRVQKPSWYTDITKSVPNKHENKNIPYWYYRGTLIIISYRLMKKTSTRSFEQCSYYPLVN